MAPDRPPAREGVRCRHVPLKEGRSALAVGGPDLPPRGVRDLHVTPGPLRARASNPPRGSGTATCLITAGAHIHARPWPAGPTDRRRGISGRRYTLQRRPRRLLGLAGRRRDIRKTKDDTQDDCHARRHVPQCTSHSVRPLQPRDSGERRRLRRSHMHVHRPSLCL